MFCTLFGWRWQKMQGKPCDFFRFLRRISVNGDRLLILIQLCWHAVIQLAASSHILTCCKPKDVGQLGIP
jgi:hypothetical protein